MKFYVSRQLQWPEGEKVVEIVQGGRDYANPGHLTIMFPRLGEGEEFTDPREACEAAIAIRDMWKGLDSDPIHISFGCTLGFTAPLDRYEDQVLREKAEALYQTLPKCGQCGDIVGKDKYHHQFSSEDFCSSQCAEKDYEGCNEPEEEDEDQEA